MVTDEVEGKGSLSRRGLLARAVGAAGLASALGSANQGDAQTRAAGEGMPARSKESFDFDWKFNKGDAPGAQAPGFADGNWRSLDVPHDWSIEGPYSEKETAQGSLPTGIGWYRKHFRVPETSRDRKLSI